MSYQNDVGYFVFSLDCELASGFFDSDELRTQIFSPDGSRERWAIECLLDMLAEFNLIATWAIVGHIFYKACEECAICPILDWKGKYKSFDEVYHSDHPLWYGGDIIEKVIARSTNKHEIGFHGYTHTIFDEKSMSKEQAQVEIQEWLRVAKRYGIVPRTVIFPRGKSGYLGLFEQAGFTNYRCSAHYPLIIRNKYFGEYIKTIDHILSISTPPIYSLDEVEVNRMVYICESNHLFGFNRNIELFLDARNLHTLRIRRIVRGIKKAADEKKIFQLWAHPWEFRTESDFLKLRYIFNRVAEEVRMGRMQSIGMADLAKIIKEYHTSKLMYL
jgi:hypothetical protein